MHFKYSRKFILRVILGLSFVLGLFILYVIAGQPKNQECRKIYDKIGVEMNLPAGFCNFNIVDVVGSSTTNFLQPKLPVIQEKEKEYEQRLSDYNTFQAQYKPLVEIAAKLGIAQNTLDFENPNQKILNINNYLKEQIQNLQNKIRLYRDTDQEQISNFNNKLLKAKDLGIDVSEYENILLQISNNKLDSPQSAEQYRNLVSSLGTNTAILNTKISIIPNDQNKYIVNFPVLMYHRIEDYEAIPRSQKSKIRREITISPGAFTTQLDFLKEKGYKTVTTRDVEQAVLTQDKVFFEQKLVMLTFDDGLKEHYTIAFPELKKRGMVGVFGVVTNFRGMTWDQLREMDKDGMEIISHTVSHCPLASASFTSQDINPDGGDFKACSANYGGKSKLMPINELKFELSHSKETLEKELNKPVKSLIYPYGSYNQQTIEVAQSLGYTIGFKVATGPGINLSEPLILGRVNVSGFDEALGGWFETIKN